MAMNEWNGIGRLTADPEVRYSQSGTAVASYTLAVARDYKRDGEPDADYFACTAFGKTAEFAEKYLMKGMLVGVSGRLRNENWQDCNGSNHVTTKIIVNSHTFCEKRSDAAPKSNTKAPKRQADENGFMQIPDGIDEELPFN